MKQRGFTLIEVMIAVVIVAVLAAVVYPSYQEQIRQARRGEIQAILQDLALQQERHRTNNTTYAAIADLDVPTSDWYTVTVTANTATTYTIQAAARNDQTKDKEVSTSCSTLTISANNAKTPAICW